MLKTKAQAFKDGVVKIYAVTSEAEKGNMPVKKLTHKVTLRYEERTVGLQRMIEARQEQIDIKYLLRTPRRRNVTTQDIVVPNDGLYYAVRKIQYPDTSKPDSMDITLEEVKEKYEIN